jgi:translocation and assembly module TamB
MNIRRAITILLTTLLLVFVAGLTGWWWLMHTGSGANWVLSKATDTVPGEFHANSVAGDLYSGLQLNGVHFESESIRVEVDSLGVAIDADLLPLSLNIKMLHADKVRLQSLPNGDGESGGENPPIELKMPFPLVFSDVNLSGIEYYGSPEADAMIVTSIEAAGNLSQNLVLDRLEVALPEDRLELSGQAALEYPHALSLKFRSSGQYDLNGELRGDAESAELVLDTDNPAAHLSGTVGQLLGLPVWDLALEAPLLHLPTDSAEPAVKLTEVQVQSIGEWPQFDLDLAANIETGWLESTQIRLAGNGSDNHFTVQKLTLDGRELSLEATGTLSWEESIQLGIDTTLKRIDPNFWLPDWPDDRPVDGRFKLQWSGDNWTFDDFSLSVAKTGLLATGSGKVDSENETITLALDWKDFSWPPGTGNSVVASESGSLQVSGRLDDWELAGNLDLQSGDYPRGQLNLSGTGNDESLNLTLKEGMVLGGTISGNLFWQWSDNQPFNAELTARQVEIEPLFPDYPGVLNTHLSVNGEIEPLRLAATIHQLDGTILDLPVMGHGGFHFQENRIFADQLFIASGSSTLTLNGSLFEPAGIDFSAKADSLARFHEDLGGSLTAEGKVSLDPDSPRILIALSGDDLVLGSIEIANIETRPPSEDGTSSFSELVLSGLNVDERPVESVSIRFDGEKPLQWVDIRVRTQDTEIHLGLNGAMNDWNNPMSAGWSGELSELDIGHLGRFNINLDQAARLNWTPSEFSLEPACLSSTMGAHLCVSSDWHAPSELNISAELDGVPVGLLDLAMKSDLIFTQILSGKLSWSQTAATDQKAMARFRMTPGSIRVMDHDEVLLETGDGLFGFEMSGGRLQKGNLDLKIPGSGEIDVDFSVADTTLGLDSPIQGNVRVDFRDLSKLNQIIPLVDSINGEVDVDLTLAGVISDPAFNGTAFIRNGHLSNSTSGFSFSDINISGEINDSDRAELEGTFRAGEGTGDIKTIVFFENTLSPVIELTLQGQSLTIIDVPDLLVVADPDIELGWQNKTLKINGRLLIPKARLSPSYLPQTSARQSEDVVIVGGELPVPEDDFMRDNPIKIQGKLEVELGKEAEIELDFAQVNVSGITQFTWQDEILPIANGNFEINGDILAYGQKLKITRSRINFPNIPVDNPNLNIRAEREIYGSSQIQKAGLMVVGTVKRPIIEAYTVPMTNKNRARTLLVTGSDFNYEQGVGAFAVGTYVLPRLYVSYGIGVFEEGNVISARYDLGKRFGVKVTSGQKDTGVDLNYTIER